MDVKKLSNNIKPYTNNNDNNNNYNNHKLRQDSDLNGSKSIFKKNELLQCQTFENSFDPINFYDYNI